MKIAVLIGEDGIKCLYCSTTMWAFGPIFYSNEDPIEFLNWCDAVGISPRALSANELEGRVQQWREFVQARDVVELY